MNTSTSLSSHLLIFHQCLPSAKANWKPESKGAWHRERERQRIDLGRQMGNDQQTIHEEHPTLDSLSIQGKKKTALISSHKIVKYCGLMDFGSMHVMRVK